MNSVVIIAEAGVNHNGSLDIAKQLIDVAADAGADYVKFQTFKSELNISGSAPKADYQVKNDGDSDSQLEMVKKLELSESDHLELLAYCQFKNIKFLSTAFDSESIDLLKELGVQIGKIPSGEITNLPYLKKMAKTFPELILSTGMCSIQDIEAALEVIMNNGGDKEKITILHCNTEYPTPMTDVNLRVIPTLRNHFGTHVGYSDHTLGIEVPIAAVALGAEVIEKHFTLDRSMKGPDHLASLEPLELKNMVKGIRNIEHALGSQVKSVTASEYKNIAIARKSLHTARPVKAGSILQEEDVIAKRPGDGISPMNMERFLGRAIRRDLPGDYKLSIEDFV